MARELRQHRNRHNEKVGLPPRTKPCEALTCLLSHTPRRACPEPLQPLASCQQPVLQHAEVLVPRSSPLQLGLPGGGSRHIRMVRPSCQCIAGVGCSAETGTWRLRPRFKLNLGPPHSLQPGIEVQRL